MDSVDKSFFLHIHRYVISCNILARIDAVLYSNHPFIILLCIVIIVYSNYINWSGLFFEQTECIEEGEGCNKASRSTLNHCFLSPLPFFFALSSTRILAPRVVLG